MPWILYLTTCLCLKRKNYNISMILPAELHQFHQLLSSWAVGLRSILISSGLFLQASFEKSQHFDHHLSKKQIVTSSTLAVLERHAGKQAHEFTMYYKITKVQCQVLSRKLALQPIRQVFGLFAVSVPKSDKR